MPDTEIEFKFCLQPEQAEAVEAAVRRGRSERTRMQARYFDTADSVLAINRIALRLRKEGTRWVQTVKASGSDSLQRLEHNVDLGLAGDAALPEPDPALHSGTVVGQLLADALGHGRRKLVLTYETDVWRLIRLVRLAGGGRAELAFDKGWVRSMDCRSGELVSRPVLELELELVRGSMAGFTRLARYWQQCHGLWLSTVSKSEQGQRLRDGVHKAPPVKAGSTVFFSAMPDGREILQRALASCLEQVLSNASEVAAGSEDAEQIHQLRIGLRRLRTALRELGPLAPGAIDPGWQQSVAQALRALGALRDRTQVLQDTQERLQAAGGPALILPELPAGPAGDIVRAPQLQSALVAMLGFVAAGAAWPLSGTFVGADLAPPPGAAAAEPSWLDHEAALHYLRGRLTRLHGRVSGAAGHYADLTVGGHRLVRRRLKRLRYLSEFCATLFSSRSVARYLGRLRPAQQELGLYNDEMVALQIWRALAQQQPEAWFGVGWLVAHEAAQLRRCTHSLRRLHAAGPFWFADSAGRQRCH